MAPVVSDCSSGSAGTPDRPPRAGGRRRQAEPVSDAGKPAVAKHGLTDSALTEFAATPANIRRPKAAVRADPGQQERCALFDELAPSDVSWRHRSGGSLQGERNTLARHRFRATASRPDLRAAGGRRATPS